MRKRCQLKRSSGAHATFECDDSDIAGNLADLISDKLTDDGVPAVVKVDGAAVNIRRLTENGEQDGDWYGTINGATDVLEDMLEGMEG